MKGWKIKIVGVMAAVFILLSMGTLMPVVASQQISSNETTKNNFQPNLKIVDIREQEKYKITDIMSKYTQRTEDGSLRIIINDASNIPLSQDEIWLYKKGIEKLNELYSEGKIIIVKDVNGEYIGIPTQKLTDINIPKTYSEYIKLVQSLNISPAQKKLLTSITEKEWNSLVEKVASGAGGRGGGKNDFKISYHWYGIKYELWLDHYWTIQLCKWGIPLGVAIVAALISIATGGVALPIALAIAGVIVSNIGADYIESKDHGNGVKFTFKDYWWTPWLPIDYWKVEPQ